MKRIESNEDEFTKIKKNEQNVIIRLNDNDDNKKINDKEVIILVNGDKSLKKKVKQIRTYATIEEVKQTVKKEQLGYKKKDAVDYDNLLKDFKKADIEKYGLLSIEIKRKKHIFKKVLLALIILVLLSFSYKLANNKIAEFKAQKFYEDIDDISKQKTDFVFVEINPHLLLNVKDNKVIKTTCLNKDCKKIYDDLSLENKNIQESIDIIYNVSKEKGFDTSKGVNIKTTGKIEIEEKTHIKIEYIDEATKNEIISKIEDVDIDSTDNDDYYSNLWETLKKDPDYGKLYSCDMENGELACYLTWNELSSNANPVAKEKKYSEIKYVLEKFGIKTEAKTEFGFTHYAESFYIDGKKFDGKGLCDTHMVPTSDPEATGFVGTDIGYYNDFSHARDGKLYCITLVKEPYGLNLLNPSSIWKRARVIDDPMAGYIKPTYDENGNITVTPVN